MTAHIWEEFIMKKLISAILSALILTTTLTACGGSPGILAGSANGSEKGACKITIVQPMSHTSLDQIRDTIVAELEIPIRTLSLTPKTPTATPPP